MNRPEGLSKSKAWKALALGMLGGTVLGGGIISWATGEFNTAPLAHCQNRNVLDFPEWPGDAMSQREIKDLTRWLHTSSRSIEAGLGGTALCDVRFTDEQIESASAHAQVKDISANCLVLDQAVTRTDGQVPTELFCAIPDGTPMPQTTPDQSIND
jgi:hypothetical protein